MTSIARVPESPYERLLDVVDSLASDPDVPVNLETERLLEQLVIEGVADSSIDRELHVGDIVRWLTGFIHGHRALRVDHAEIDPDVELALMRTIVTRWLHPARRDA